MTQNIDRRLAELERCSPARGHVCEIVKVRADGTEEEFTSFWTRHPVTKIRVVYQKVRGIDGIEASLSLV